jgi:hypothetical protein
VYAVTEVLLFVVTQDPFRFQLAGKPHAADRVGASVHQVTHQNQAIGAAHKGHLMQQFLEFPQAPMHVTDHDCSRHSV